MDLYVSMNECWGGRFACVCVWHTYRHCLLHQHAVLGRLLRFVHVVKKQLKRGNVCEVAGWEIQQPSNDYLVPAFDKAVGINTDPMVPVHKHDPGVTIRPIRVICILQGRNMAHGARGEAQYPTNG